KYLDETRAADWKPGRADTDALYAYGKSRASIELPGLRHLWEAKTVFEHYLRLKPGGEPAETILLEIYPHLYHNQEAVSLAEDVIARAKMQVDEHPNDPRFELVLASAYVYANKFPDAVQWLRTAAARKATDVKFVDELVFRLDALGRYRDSLAVLERSATELSLADPSLRRKLVQRQWQAGQFAVVADGLKE